MTADTLHAPPAFRRYLAAVLGTLLTVAALAAIPLFRGFGTTGALNDFALPFKGDHGWYRDFAGRDSGSK